VKKYFMWSMNKGVGRKFFRGGFNGKKVKISKKIPKIALFSLIQEGSQFFAILCGRLL